MRQLPLGVRLRDRADFENFHAGRSQSLVDAVLGLLAPDGSGCALLAGPAGSGKSHLLQAACARLPGGAYFPLGELGALGPGVLEGAEGLPVACIDDVQQVSALFLAAWQKENPQVTVSLGDSAPASQAPALQGATTMQMS